MHEISVCRALIREAQDVVHRHAIVQPDWRRVARRPIPLVMGLRGRRFEAARGRAHHLVPGRWHATATTRSQAAASEECREAQP